MTPNSHLYFDYYQSEDRDDEPLAIGGFIPLEQVYEYEPVPDELDEVEARHVLGAQGNVWTEYMKTGDHVEYMVFPRALALAELTWSPRDRKSYGAFLERLPWHLDRLAALGVAYGPLDSGRPRD
jgi:hexosaminidase